MLCQISTNPQKFLCVAHFSPPKKFPPFLREKKGKTSPKEKELTRKRKTKIANNKAPQEKTDESFFHTL